MAARRSFLHLALLLIGLAGVTAARSAEREPIKFPDAQYEPVDWTKPPLSRLFSRAAGR